MALSDMINDAYDTRDYHMFANKYQRRDMWEHGINYFTNTLAYFNDHRQVGTIKAIQQRLLWINQYVWQHDVKMGSYDKTPIPKWRDEIEQLVIKGMHI